MDVTPADLKNALSAWVVAASGLDADQVEWTHKMVGFKKPTPHFTMRALNLRLIGQPQLRYTTIDPEPSQPDYPLTATSDGSYEFNFVVTAWGGEDPTDLLSNVRAQAELPSIRRALRAAGVGLGEMQQVIEHGMVQDRGEPGLRASMDCMAFVRMSVTETPTPAIETIHATSNAVSPVETFDMAGG